MRGNACKGQPLPTIAAAFASLSCAAGSRAAGDVERYSDRTRQSNKPERPPLTSILTLDPRYFPEELYSTKQQM